MILLSESELLGSPLSEAEQEIAAFILACEQSSELYGQRETSEA